jgi:acyl transferase domain-containing protein
VIRNSGTNQDGKTNGITLPSGQAQVGLIDSLYRSAGLDPVDTTMVEAHGTGTAAGDPIEAASLSKLFSVGRSGDDPLKVGSIKSNIGHLEGGSGIAGVIKTILMLERGLILPNFDFRNPNSRIPMKDWKLKVGEDAHSNAENTR